jgi:hypothetical protein
MSAGLIAQTIAERTKNMAQANHKIQLHTVYPERRDDKAGRPILATFGTALWGSGNIGSAAARIQRFASISHTKAR